MVTDSVQSDQVLFVDLRNPGLVESQRTNVAVGAGQELDAIGEHFAESNVLKGHHVANSPEGLQLASCGAF